MDKKLIDELGGHFVSNDIRIFNRIIKEQGFVILKKDRLYDLAGRNITDELCEESENKIGKEPWEDG